ncbi:MAG: hypothetical protein GX800_11880 [Clostridiaceae bacterium]|nr:hypothetical protein [Clostridiaceae bacterium]
MSIPEQKTINNDSSDSAEYRKAFYCRSLLLLVNGYQLLLSEANDFSNSEETDITGELVRCSNAYIDNLASPDWVVPYTVNEESPENTGERKGKRRKRVDVVCTLTQRRPHLRLKFEAKRLKNKLHPVSAYLGKEGLGEFLTGNYAPESDVAAMLGYIQTDNCVYWKHQISEKLSENNIELHHSGLAEISNSYLSVHNRVVTQKSIAIYHLLLDFT